MNKYYLSLIPALALSLMLSGCRADEFIAAFKSPSFTIPLIVSSTVCAPSLKWGYKSVSVSGTTYCNGVWATSGIAGGTSVTLRVY